MHKFTISNKELPNKFDEKKPSLYKIYFGNYYYLHKGKELDSSADRLLEDVFRGMRGKSCPEPYSILLKHCIRFPSINKVSLEVVLNADSDKILRLEDKLYKALPDDPYCLNRLDISPYKPEWMLKQSLQKRCESCVLTGIIDTKKVKFKFCPNCGRINK